MVVDNLVGTTGMEIVVLGGHVNVGLSKKDIAPPGLTTWSRTEMVVGRHVCPWMYVTVRWA